MNDTERREYSRVDAYIPLRARLMPAGELCGLRSRISTESTISHLQSLPDLEDRALSESLKVINAKLDAILNLLSFRDKDSYCLESVQVTISGSGVSFESKEPYSLGDLVELRLIIPVAPELVFYVYGEVVNSCEEGDGVYKICIRFTVIDEEIRDRIVKFVFEKQREMLRKLRRQ